MSQLGSEGIAHVGKALDRFCAFFPDATENYLVHADFDPANILVHQKNGRWQISGILDWEFAFAGSSLCDVANMLRYAHQMPDAFQTAFLKGVEEHGVKLPTSWQLSVHVLNLLSLLDCLAHGDPLTRPNQTAEIKSLIQHILGELTKQAQLPEP